MTSLPLPSPAPDDDPAARLLPIARALLERGYTLTRPGSGGSPFAPGPAGPLAVFAEPLDIGWIERAFAVPVDISHHAGRDELHDRRTGAAIYGSCPPA